MNGPEFDLSAIMGELDGILSKKQLDPPAHSEDICSPSEYQVRNDLIEFERNIQRPHVLMFMEINAALLKQPEGRKRTVLFRDGVFSYLKDSAGTLRKSNKFAEADVLENINSKIIGEIVSTQIADEETRLGRQLPGTDEYVRIDSRIKFLDRWSKFCDDLINLERSEGAL